MTILKHFVLALTRVPQIDSANGTDRLDLGPVKNRNPASPGSQDRQKLIPITVAYEEGDAPSNLAAESEKFGKVYRGNLFLAAPRSHNRASLEGGGGVGCWIRRFRRPWLLLGPVHPAASLGTGAEYWHEY